ncbi:GNAT family N-acetyltransferase [Planococcus sp. YIM B11945]|uniref:GNAT family N-acetyltransferase n=1 Tax=Planococcus sp. YIM B11945 TaxID=3435410 RepID=UPI003D7E0FC9
MDIQFIKLRKIAGTEYVLSFLQLHESIFGADKDLLNKIESKPETLIFLALHDSRVVGYKMGYRLDEQMFYSWLGGVDPAYRAQAIASRLMELQHNDLKRAGYKKVQTKTKNKWRSMLILNIKSGFEVVDTYIDDDGETKIVLEKKLAE